MKYVKIIGVSGIAILIFIKAILWHLSPILKPFPALTGTYIVGMRSFTFIDYTRMMHEGDSRKRALPVDIYYPASGKRKGLYNYKPAFYQARADYFAANSIVPQSILRKVVKGIQSNVQTEAVVSQELQKYPVIIFSPGIGAAMTYGAYLQDLASWGYIIVELQHPYDLEITVFHDGSIIHIDPAFEKAIKDNDRSFIYAYRGKQHWVWLADLEFVLNQLEKLNNDPEFFLYRKLDLRRLGVLGSSHGGAVAIDFVKRNSRVRAGINADGWTKTANTAEPFNKPFMFLWADSEGPHNGQELYDNMKLINTDVSAVIVPGSGHAISDDELLKWPLGGWLDKSAILNQKQIAIRDFFEKYLKNI